MGKKMPYVTVVCPHCGKVKNDIYFDVDSPKLFGCLSCGNSFAARVKEVYVVETHVFDSWKDNMLQAPKVEPAAPAKPQPDWSKAPEWAKWWAVDADGEAFWYELEPSRGFSCFSGTGDTRRAGVVDVEDWRETLTARPEPKHPLANLDWGRLPDWAKWVAVDSSGEAYCYEREPKKLYASWDTPGNMWSLYEVDLDGFDWKQTKLQRPEGV
jgi:transcription elongation factor Elf1